MVLWTEDRTIGKRFTSVLFDYCCSCGWVETMSLNCGQHDTDGGNLRTRKKPVPMPLCPPQIRMKWPWIHTVCVAQAV
jgi:hypothetical protein